MSKAVIEVGANRGTDTVKLAKKYEGIAIYAIEPTPKLYKDLTEKFRENAQVTVFQLAIDNKDGVATFNIAGHHDWGCSSLHEFTEKEHLFGQWKHRPDFYFNDKCEVKTSRLDTFIEAQGITEVEFLWIDSQGHDFTVLKSLGKKLSIIKEGVCETAWGANLYQQTDNNVEDVTKWLIDNGFIVTKVETAHGHEANVYFKRQEK